MKRPHPDFPRVLTASLNLLVFILVALVFAAPHVARGDCVPPPGVMRSWFRAEGNGSDVVGNSSATAVGNAGYGPGYICRGFVLDGTNSGFQISSGASWYMRQEFGIEAWVRRASSIRATANGDDSGSLLGWSTGGWSFEVRNDGRLRLAMVGSSAVETTSPVLVDTSFHHVAVTKVFNNVVFYVDGVAYPAATLYNPGFTFSGTVVIGARGDFTHSFLGTIDELSFYQSVTSTEIQSIYNAGTAGKCLGIPTVPVWMPNTNVVAGGTVTVPVMIVANGYENSFGFSIRFDPNYSRLSFLSASPGSGLAAAGAILEVNTNQLGSNAVGLALLMPPGATFPGSLCFPQTQVVAQVTFVADFLVAPGPSAIMPFQSEPIAQQLLDTNVNALPVNYGLSSIVITAPTAIEGDVLPRPNGDLAVLLADWITVGRYAARFDYPTNSSEFQRADCAPRASFGNGAITVADWIQAGRYFLGLDPLAPGGGPTNEIVPAGAGPSATRIVRIGGAAFTAGQTNSLSVSLSAQGNENAVGFSLSFDPAQASFVSAALGSGASGGQLYVNTTQAGSGRVGFALALGVGDRLPAGSNELVRVSFHAAPSGPNNFPVTFGDGPIVREVADDGAAALPASYSNATVSVVSLLLLRVAVDGQSVRLSWPLGATNCILQETTNIAVHTNWTDLDVTNGMSDTENFVTLPLHSGSRFYRLMR